MSIIGNPALVAATSSIHVTLAPVSIRAEPIIGGGTGKPLAQLVGAQEAFGVALFSTTLTAAQVLNHYQAGAMLVNPSANCRLPVRVGASQTLKLYARFNGPSVTGALIAAGSRITARPM